MAGNFGGQSKYLKKKRKILNVIILLIFVIYIILLTLYIEHIKDISLNLLWWIPLLTVVVMHALYRFGIRMMRLDDKYRSGQKGEGDIYFELQNLPKEFFVFQDVQIPELSGNIDFVVLGPTGLFTVEVKNYSGHITLENGILLHDQKPFEKDILKQATGQWQVVSSFLKDKINEQVFIQPIIVFSHNAKVQFGMKPVAKNILVLQKEWLNRAISERPNIFSSEKIDKLSIHLTDIVKK